MTTTSELSNALDSCPRWCEGHSAGNLEDHGFFHRSRSWSWDTSLGADCIVELGACGAELKS